MVVDNINGNISANGAYHILNFGDGERQERGNEYFFLRYKDKHWELGPKYPSKYKPTQMFDTIRATIALCPEDAPLLDRADFSWGSIKISCPGLTMHFTVLIVISLLVVVILAIGGGYYCYRRKNSVPSSKERRDPEER